MCIGDEDSKFHHMDSDFDNISNVQSSNIVDILISLVVRKLAHTNHILELRILDHIVSLPNQVWSVLIFQCDLRLEEDALP